MLDLKYPLDVTFCVPAAAGWLPPLVSRPRRLLSDLFPLPRSALHRLLAGPRPLHPASTSPSSSVSSPCSSFPAPCSTLAPSTCNPNPRYPPDVALHSLLAPHRIPFGWLPPHSPLSLRHSPLARRPSPLDPRLLTLQRSRSPLPVAVSPQKCASTLRNHPGRSSRRRRRRPGVWRHAHRAERFRRTTWSAALTKPSRL